VAELIAFSKQPGLGAIKHLRPVIAPVADGRVSRLHNHLVRVVGMEKVERRARVASFVVDAWPAVVVARMQDEGKTVVDLGDEFIGFGGNQGERLKVCSIRPLPCVPNAGEGERAGLGQCDVEDALCSNRMCSRSLEMS
jgi:hypothetical protein